MKKVLFVFMFLMGFSTLQAENDTLFSEGWQEIICHITRKVKASIRHMPIQTPCLFLSGQYIYVMSENRDYTDAQLVVKNEYGVELAGETLQIYAGQYNPCYIGDLECGTYYVQLTIGSCLLEGSFKIE